MTPCGVCIRAMPTWVSGRVEFVIEEKENGVEAVRILLRYSALLTIWTGHAVSRCMEYELFHSVLACTITGAMASWGGGVVFVRAVSGACGS